MLEDDRVTAVLEDKDRLVIKVSVVYKDTVGLKALSEVKAKVVFKDTAAVKVTLVPKAKMVSKDALVIKVTAEIKAVTVLMAVKDSTGTKDASVVRDKTVSKV